MCFDEQAIGTNSYTGTTKAIWFEVTVMAMVRFYRADEVAGLIIQGDREIRIGNLDITAPQWGSTAPAKLHEVWIDGAKVTIQSVAAEKMGGRVTQYVIQARG